MARETAVSLEIVRFTQDSIKNTFKEPYEYQRIDDAVDQIGNNQLSPAVLMPLHVVKHKSDLWSLDNRRLWVLRKAGVPTVEVIFVLPDHNNRAKEFFSSLMINPRMEGRYSSANYFPRVRGGVRSHVGICIKRRKRTGDDPLTRTPHYPTAVAGANNTTAMTPPPPTATVRIDIPVSANPEAASSVCGYQYSSADYFPQVRGDCRFVGISPPPPIKPLQLDHSATRFNAGAAQANYRPPNSPPPQRSLIDSTVRSNTLVSNSNSCPGGKKGSDTFWGEILNAVNCAMEKGFGILRFLTSWDFDPCNEKFVRLGMNSLVVLCLCFALRQSYKLGQGSVSTRETIFGKGLRHFAFSYMSSIKVFGAENRGGSSENVLSDQNNNNGGASGYFGIVAFKAGIGVEKMTSHLLTKMSCFRRSVVQNCVDLSKGVVADSRRKALDTSSIVLSECFSSLHFITGQAAVSFGRMGIRVSEFCLEKTWEMLRFIKCQAFGVPGQMFGGSVGNSQDVLSFYMNEIKEFLRKVVCSPQMALSFCLNKVKELAQGVITFCLNKIKELLGLQDF